VPQTEEKQSQKNTTQKTENSSMLYDTVNEE